MDERTIMSGRLRGTTVGLLILITLIAFEAMAVSAALPTAARDVHGLAGYGWAFTGFLVANIVGMVASGQLSDARGPRPPLVAGLAFFLAGLVLAGTRHHDGAARRRAGRPGARRRSDDHRDVRGDRPGVLGPAAAGAVRRDLGGVGACRPSSARWCPGC